MQPLFACYPLQVTQLDAVMQVSLHAIGDRAVDEVAAACEDALAAAADQEEAEGAGAAAVVSGARFAIEHVQVRLMISRRLTPSPLLPCQLGCLLSVVLYSKHCCAFAAPALSAAHIGTQHDRRPRSGSPQRWQGPPPTHSAARRRPPATAGPQPAAPAHGP